MPSGEKNPVFSVNIFISLLINSIKWYMSKKLIQASSSLKDHFLFLCTVPGELTFDHSLNTNGLNWNVGKTKRCSVWQCLEWRMEERKRMWDCKIRMLLCLQVSFLQWKDDLIIRLVTLPILWNSMYHFICYFPNASPLPSNSGGPAVLFESQS